mmetsp:Transcript_6111/g.17044  ORF Transcript_6111/g.17044 Transcript_6111/m.17044 type:complete len:435 (+) Transcript_6111:166-1470(+)
MVRPSEESSWGKLIEPARACLKELPGVEPGAIKSDPSETVEVPEKTIDFDLQGLSNVTFGARQEDPRTIKKVRIDLGWSFIKQKVAEDEDEPDLPDMDLNCAFYDAKGEEIQVINFGSREADGASLSTDDTISDPDKITAHESDRVGFPVDESVFIDFRLIPKKTKSIVVGITNYSGGGFSGIKKLYCRIVDITNEKDPSCWRDIHVFHTDTAESSNPELTGLIVCKLMKEAKVSKFWEWRKSQEATTADVTGGLLAAEDKTLQESLQVLVEEQHIISGQDLEKEDDEEEEEPEEEEDEEGVVKDDPDAENWNWRVRVMHMFVKGETWEEAAEDIATAATFEGLRDNNGWRSDPCAKAVYNNGDVYYGGYLNDRRSGKGVYIFANKGCYAGGYRNGLRAGYGMMWWVPPHKQGPGHPAALLLIVHAAVKQRWVP